jgi:dimethylargininase
MRPTAIVRAVGDSYVGATRAIDHGPIDVALARRQHAAYVEALGTLGYNVLTPLPADEALPDGVFVEDQAVVVGGRALLTRSGHAPRRAEAESVARALAELGLEVVRTPDDAILDGGDVLRLGKTLLVGRSDRTDEAGIAALGRAFPECDVVSVGLPPDVLHLKCFVSSPLPGVVVHAPDRLRIDVGAERVIAVPPEEAWAANTLGRGNRIVVGAGFPRTAKAVRDAGFEPVTVDVSEFRKGDGSLTCLSILL